MVNPAEGWDVQYAAPTDQLFDSLIFVFAHHFCFNELAFVICDWSVERVEFFKDLQWMIQKPLKQVNHAITITVSIVMQMII